MNRQDFEAAVLVALRMVLECEVDLDSSRQNTPQWDSLKHILVVFNIEDRLAIEFTEQEMPSLDSVRRIVDVVIGRHAA